MRLTLHLAAARAAEISVLAGAVGRPGDPHHGAHLSRAELAAWVSPRPEERAALRAWLSAAGIDGAATGLGDQVWTATVEPAALVRLLGPVAARELIARRRLAGERARARLPAEIATWVLALDVGPWQTPGPAYVLVDPGGPTPPVPATGLLPAALARGYGLDGGADGDGETIAVMALGGVPDAADLHRFARAFGLPPPRVELVPLTPLGDCAADPRFRFETTMGLQWLAVAAPRARIVVYLIDPCVARDPWATFLLAAISDMERLPSIAVTSWSAPARQYYPVHGRAIFASLLDQAAVLGLSVVAASGDWGAHDGFPGAGPARTADDLAPRDTFPGCEARVLSVGGTHVPDVAAWREIAWSAPVSAALERTIGLPRLAGSGGASAHVPVPDYQRPWLPGSLSRGPGVDPQLVSGRVQPDVALMAWGADVAGPDGPRPTAYACLFDGQFRDDAGGTSVAAPIWAGIVARLNQLRRRAGLPRLGQPQPMLYAALARHPDLLRDIQSGRTDIDLPVIAAHGDRVWQRLPGFEAGPGFDAATGLGAPVVSRLEEILVHRPETIARRTTMKARMYQRRHARSPRALAKPYTFLDTGVRVDVAPLVEELAGVTLPYLESLWKWHRGTRFCVLRGGPRGALPGDELTTGHGVDAPILASLPRLRAVLDGVLGFRAPLAWIGLSPPDSAIRMHVDNTAHWDEHHRLHVPLVTTPGARLCVLRRFHHLPAGHLFAFNNSRPHGAINEGPARLHLVLDVPRGPAIDALLAGGMHVEGELDERALGRLSEDPLADLTAEERRSPELMNRFLNQ